MNPTPEHLLEFWHEDHALRVGRVDQQLNRMWLRFNFFLTIQSALFGLTFTEIKGALVPNVHLLAVVGFVICVWWYIFGAQERYLVDLFRRQLSFSAEQLTAQLAISPYDYVGKTEEITMTALPPASWDCWRVQPISLTRLPCIIPVITAVAWLATYFLK